MNFQQVLFLFSVFVSVRGDLVKYLLDKIASNDTEPAPALRIVGGSAAQEHTAPWVVSIQILMRGQLYHICGGGIISPEWIVTAAHCIDGDGHNYAISAGRYNLRELESSTEQVRSIYKVYRNPQFQGGISPNDIALIQLSRPLTFTASVNKANLPDGSLDDTRGSAKVYGWGSTSRSSYPAMPGKLRTMNAPLISVDTCRQILRAGSLITEKNICTGPLDGSISACVGDSGSSLTKGNTIIGVVSWGLDPCGIPNSASVYTRVSSYKNWISSTIAQENRF